MIAIGLTVHVILALYHLFRALRGRERAASVALLAVTCGWIPFFAYGTLVEHPFILAWIVWLGVAIGGAHLFFVLDIESQRPR